MSDTDSNILHRVSSLVAEEHRLRTHPNPTDDDLAALRTAERELDQCWDLLRQRRAKQEMGQDPEGTHLRPVSEVEGYLQ